MKKKALHKSKLKKSPAVHHGTHLLPESSSLFLPNIHSKIIMSPLTCNEKLLIPFQTASFPNVLMIKRCVEAIIFTLVH